MDLRALAGYAYHNCEFRHAVDLIRSGTPDDVLAEIHVKCLAELDEKDAGVKWAQTYAHAFPRAGSLRYLVGMARYLAGHPAPEVNQAFAEADALGHPSGA